MDTKRLLTQIVIVGLMMVAFMYIFRSKSNEPAATAPAAAPIYAAVPAGAGAAEQDARPATFILGGANKGDPYKIGVVVDNVTAGIDKVELNAADYAETVKGTEPYKLFEAPAIGPSPLPKPFSDLGIHITVGNSGKELPYGLIHGKNAGEPATRPATMTDSAEAISQANSTNIFDSQYVWKPVEQTPTDVVLQASFSSDNKPVAEIQKIFHLDPKSYEIMISHKIINKTDQTIHVRIDQLGPPNLRRDDPRIDDRFFHAEALDSAKKVLNDDRFNATQSQLPGMQGGQWNFGQFADFSKDPFLWAASGNRFFAAIVRPAPISTTPVLFNLANGRQIPEVHHVSEGSLDLLYAATKEKYADAVAALHFTGASLEIPPGGSLTEPLAVFLGPKKRELLNNTDATPPNPSATFTTYEYYKIMQFSARGCFLYSLCVRDEVVYPILWLLDFFKRTIAFGNYGVAIMILVVLVRALLHPLTRSGQINMAKMGKKMKDIQPKLDAVKKKYADNKQKQSEEMMRLYRENHINPAGGIMGCLPMMLQLPIWAALYSGLALDIDLRHASFIPGWINDLSNPDTVLPTSAPVWGHPLFTLPIFNFEIYGLNPLPLLLAVVLFINMKVTMATQPKPADDSQAQAQKWSQYSILILPFALYNASSGSNLYYFASTMVGLVDTYFVRKSLKKQGILPASAEALPTHADAEKEKK